MSSRWSEDQVRELPVTAQGYGPQIVLPIAGSSAAWLTSDSAGDVFVPDSFNDGMDIVEYTPTNAAYSTSAIPLIGYNSDDQLTGIQPVYGVAVDSAGDLYVAGSNLTTDDDEVINAAQNVRRLRRPGRPAIHGAMLQWRSDQWCGRGFVWGCHSGRGK